MVRRFAILKLELDSKREKNVVRVLQSFFFVSINHLSWNVHLDKESRLLSQNCPLLQAALPWYPLRCASAMTVN